MSLTEILAQPLGTAPRLAAWFRSAPGFWGGLAPDDDESATRPAATGGEPGYLADLDIAVEP